MPTTPPPFTCAALAGALRACLLATASDRSLGEVLDAIEEVCDQAGALLGVARHLEEEMLVDLGAVVLGGWAAGELAPVPDVVPAAWLTAEGPEGGQA